jgi:hypothetical protein
MDSAPQQPRAMSSGALRRWPKTGDMRMPRMRISDMVKDSPLRTRHSSSTGTRPVV